MMLEPPIADLGANYDAERLLEMAGRLEQQRGDAGG
jgi:hypothetical protein